MKRLIFLFAMLAFMFATSLQAQSISREDVFNYGNNEIGLRMQYADGSYAIDTIEVYKDSKLFSTIVLNEIKTDSIIHTLGVGIYQVRLKSHSSGTISADIQKFAGTYNILINVKHKSYVYKSIISTVKFTIKPSLFTYSAADHYSDITSDYNLY